MTTIYEQIGGSAAVNAAVDLFYDKVTSDPGLAPYFTGVEMPRLKGHQRAFLTAAMGGPTAYKGRDMGTAHAELLLTDADFDAVVGHLVATLEELKVPAETIGQVGEALAPLRAEIVTRTTVP